MSRIFAIDYGDKRCGLAMTDPLRLTAQPVGAFSKNDLLVYLDTKYKNNEIHTIVVGLPVRLNGTATHSTENSTLFSNLLNARYNNCLIVRWDERFTSKLAQRSLIESGVNKTKRKDKNIIDTISATLILQNYLESLTI